MTDNDDDKKPGTAFRYFVRASLLIGIYLTILFIASGSIDWVNAWVLAILLVSFVAVNSAVLFKYNPGLLVSRQQLLQKETKAFDRVFIPLFILVTILMYIVIGLDHRLGWSSMPVWLNLAGVALFIPGCVLLSWSMTVNQHFETTVLIRMDGRQRVASAGPYRLVRHPGYLAALICAVSYPLILGSWAGFAPVFLFFPLFIVRTALEDRALRQELPGYQQYTATTKARLLPRVW
jgi:protein-S-isoprenylcysteine O-methyltransferase Ste14